ncbi:MAG: transcription antitermination factor NusB, partial [Sedimentisphaerales bacterium]|nr:transcription antitermination factor NusB [Sedimentisphaerales bacterium]
MTNSPAQNKSELPQIGREDPRRQARELTIQFLHQLSLQGEGGMEGLEGFLAEYAENAKAGELARAWITGTWVHHDELDVCIKTNSSNWDLTRMNLVDHNNLRLAAYHLIYCPEIPYKVVINEAVELAKR